MTETNPVSSGQVTIMQDITADLIAKLLSPDTTENAYQIADTIAALFEFTGNDQFTLWLVTNELEKFANAPEI